MWSLFSKTVTVIPVLTQMHSLIESHKIEYFTLPQACVVIEVTDNIEEEWALTNDIHHDIFSKTKTKKLTSKNLNITQIIETIYKMAKMLSQTAHEIALK